MSEKLPENASLRQLRIQAKERIRSVRIDDPSSPFQLSDAQLEIARQYGFDSWPKLVAHFETPIQVEKLKTAIETGDADTLQRLLRANVGLRKHLNEPLFAFETQPILRAAQHPKGSELLPILVRYGANPNIRSNWWAGGFSALDLAEVNNVEVLLGLGARLDISSAARLGRVDAVKELLALDPTTANHVGGDGQRPLHVAKTAEIAKLLIENGADLEAKDIDHESTPIQYQINNLDVVKQLLLCGAESDVFTAVVLDDVKLLRAIVQNNPGASDHRVGAIPFVTRQSNGGHIYTYLLGSGKSAIQVSDEHGSKSVLALLQSTSPPARRLIAAAWMADARAVDEFIRHNPEIGLQMGPDARAICDAAQAGKLETVRLLLQAGLDPNTTGMDSGSALHIACWYGWAEIVRELIGRVPLDQLDQHHGSPPLGWATHGAQHCRNPKGDYIAVVEMLILAGADPNAAANRNGASMIAQSGSRTDVIETLKRFRAN